MVQWLGLSTFTVKSVGLIPGWGTKIPQASQCSPLFPPSQKKRWVRRGPYRIDIASIPPFKVSY